MELTAIATNLDYSDLRSDMVTEVCVREFAPHIKGHPSAVAMTAIDIIRYLCLTIEVLSDELGKGSK